MSSTEDAMTLSSVAKRTLLPHYIYTLRMEECGFVPSLLWWIWNSLPFGPSSNVWGAWLGLPAFSFHRCFTSIPIHLSDLQTSPEYKSSKHGCIFKTFIPWFKERKFLPQKNSPLTDQQNSCKPSPCVHNFLLVLSLDVWTWSTSDPIPNPKPRCLISNSSGLWNVLNALVFWNLGPQCMVTSHLQATEEFKELESSEFTLKMETQHRTCLRWDGWGRRVGPPVAPFNSLHLFLHLQKWCFILR